MVSKSELDAQVSGLQRQFRENTKPQPASPAPQVSADDSETTAEESLSDAFASLDTDLLTDPDIWAQKLDEALTEIDNFPHKKALLLALGVFALGFMAGRSR